MPSVNVGEHLLSLALASGCGSTFVVGTGKNVGKTVVLRAMLQAAAARGIILGVTSIGRDGEALDAVDSQAKPRLFLEPGTVLAAARPLIPLHPASEILELTGDVTAAGKVVLARVRQRARYEIAGPSTASGIRGCIERFAAVGCEHVLIDGAVDRLAALAGGSDAVILCAGAGVWTTMEEAVNEVRALAARVGTPLVDAGRPALRVPGALTLALAAQLSAAAEHRQVVVRDATRIIMPGQAFLSFRERLDLRCERPLHPLAVTAASIGRGRYFEPHAFLEAVAQATGLPAFDVYAGARAA